MGLFDIIRKTAEQYYDEGNTFLLRGEFEEAVTSFDRAIAIKPDFAGAWNDRGIALCNLGRHEEAVASLDRAVTLTPDFAEAWSNRGIPLGELGRDEEAVASYDRAVAIKPDYADAWRNRGIPLGYLGRHADALSSYDRAIALRPDFADAWIGRGWALFELGRHSEAVDSYETAIVLDPENIVAWDGKGYILKELKRYSEAVTAYEGVLLIDPRNESALAEKRELLTRIHREQQTRENEDRQRLITRIREAESLGVLPIPVRGFVQKPDTLVYPDQVETLLSQLDEFLMTARPQLHLALSCNQVVSGTWEKASISLTNEGSAHATNITVDFSDDVDVRCVRKTMDVPAKETRLFEIAVKAKVGGTIPLDTTVTYFDARGRSFSDTFGFWLVVTENEKIPPKNTGALTEHLNERPHIIYNVTGNAQFGDKTHTEIKNEGVIVRSPPGSEMPAERTFCPRCHQKIEGKMRFCPECGQDLREQ